MAILFVLSLVALGLGWYSCERAKYLLNEAKARQADCDRLLAECRAVLKDAAP